MGNVLDLVLVGILGKHQSRIFLNDVVIDL